MLQGQRHQNVKEKKAERQQLHQSFGKEKRQLMQRVKKQPIWTAAETYTSRNTSWEDASCEQNTTSQDT